MEQIVVTVFELVAAFFPLLIFFIVFILLIAFSNKAANKANERFRKAMLEIEENRVKQMADQTAFLERQAIALERIAEKSESP